MATSAEFISLLKGATKRKFPALVEPMLATRIDAAFDDPKWIYEIKHDGYRVISYNDGKQVKLMSRNGQNLTASFQRIAAAIKDLGHRVVLDGEVVALNAEGVPDFETLQNYKKIGPERLRYYIFDILWIDGHDITTFPLIKRKEILELLLSAAGPYLIYTSHIEKEGKKLFELVNERGLEGIVAKKADSFYLPGKRVNTWLKVPTEIIQDFVIGGWTESDSRPFKSLLFGAWTDDGLTYIGHAGGGFKDKQMKEILTRLKTLEQEKSPFVNEADTDRKVHWVKPVLVAEIKYATWTKAGKIRKPAIFKRFRTDKDPQEVVLETSEITAKKELSNESRSNWPLIEAEKITSDNHLEVTGRSLIIHNIEKELWPGPFTKADLINYYINVADHILPYLKNKPVSMHIKPDGPYEPGFYIKDMEGHGPEWLRTFAVERIKKVKGKRDVIDYLICNDLASLLYMIDLGCIDVNTWLSPIQQPDKPDFCFIDLDPSDDDFTKALEVALIVKEILDGMGADSYVKTSGKTGVHVCVPLGRRYTYEESLGFAEVVGEAALRINSRIITLNRNVSQRRKKVYIDCYQNIKGQTIAAPYCIRPGKQPLVSTPLTWEEIKQFPDPKKFRPDMILEKIRSKQFKDPFLGVLSKGIDMKECLQTLLLKRAG